MFIKYIKMASRKKYSRKRGGWKYNKSPTDKDGKKPLHNRHGYTSKKGFRGGKCPCAASKFFSGGSAYLEGAKNVVPMADYSNDPQRMVTIGNMPYKGGRRRTMRKNSKICKTCGRKQRGGAALSFSNVISSFGAPDMNNLSNSVFSTKSMTNPLVYSQDSAKQSTMV